MCGDVVQLNSPKRPQDQRAVGTVTTEATYHALGASFMGGKRDDLVVSG